MQLKSSAFTNMERIPDEFTCQGQDINPPLSISGQPEETGSLALIMEDPDAPAGTWDHWMVFNIDPTLEEVTPGVVPFGGTEVMNSFGKNEYGGPCPPEGQEHRYIFRIYALSSMLDSSTIFDKPSLKSAITEHQLDKAELIGVYSRNHPDQVS